MAIKLNEEVVNRTTLEGSDDFELPQGKKLKIETGPQGEELLEFTAPANCPVRVYVSITY